MPGQISSTSMCYCQEILNSRELLVKSLFLSSFRYPPDVGLQHGPVHINVHSVDEKCVSPVHSGSQPVNVT